MKQVLRFFRTVSQNPINSSDDSIGTRTPGALRPVRLRYGPELTRYVVLNVELIAAPPTLRTLRPLPGEERVTLASIDMVLRRDRPAATSKYEE